MKKETIEKRIEENLFTKKGTLKNTYWEVIFWLTTYNTKRAYPKSWKNSWAKLIDKSPKYEFVLRTLGIDYVTGNDAPRGGQEGFYFELTAKGRRQIRDYAKAHAHVNL